ALRGGRRGRGRPPAARVRSRVPSAAAPPGERPGRHLFPAQPGCLRGSRRERGTGAAAAVTRFEIAHETRFEYTQPIAETMMEMRLRPLDGGGQRCLDFHLEIEPRVRLRAYRDGYGNHVHYFNLLRAHPRLRVSSRSLVETGLRARRGPDVDSLVVDFLRSRPPAGDVPGVRALAAAHAPAGAEPAAVETALDGLALD